MFIAESKRELHWKVKVKALDVVLTWATIGFMLPLSLAVSVQKSSHKSWWGRVSLLSASYNIRRLRVLALLYVFVYAQKECVCVCMQSVCMCVCLHIFLKTRSIHM